MRLFRMKRLSLILILISSVSALSVFARTALRTISLPKDTVIPVALEQEISSAHEQSGDRVLAQVRTGGRDDLGFPSGTEVVGRVVSVRHHRGDDPGVLELRFERLRDPSGHLYPISASLIGLDNGSVEERRGHLVAKPGKSNDMKFVGYGAGVGVLAGALTRGGKVKLKDLLLGAALGYAAGKATQSKQKPGDVTLKPGTEFGLRLRRDTRFNDMVASNRASFQRR